MNDLFQLYDTNGPLNAVTEPTAVTVGVFDGVHCGHQHLLKQLSTFHSPLSTLVVTLTTHPSFALGRRTSEYWLDDPDEHRNLLFNTGIRYVAEMPFTPEVARLSACQMAQLMYDQLHMRALLLGYDSRFGSKQNDDFERLPQMANELAFTYGHGDPFLLDGQPVSSSRIRETLVEGTVERTADLLARSYGVCGTVVHGRGVGRTLGFPTANINISQSRKMLPKEGVYIVKVANHLGMANLGPVPTFKVDKPSLEVHLLDYQGDLYGQHVELQFLHRLRDIIRFDSAEALEQQLQQDLNACRQYE
ncbi:MAG: riboflavin biosynthesis protein RibF [Bacteroidales bacterium]|nr:riboflavin biosynthesis protein RibF [Bacteroidales bacterium]